MSLEIQLQEGSPTFDKVIKWIGIIAVKTNRTQKNSLFSDVLVVVASLDLKVPTNLRRRRNLPSRDRA